MEFALTPGGVHDSKGMRNLFFNLSSGNTVYGDSDYTDYIFEDQMKDAEDISLKIARKSNSKRNHDPGRIT